MVAAAFEGEGAAPRALIALVGLELVFSYAVLCVLLCGRIVRNADAAANPIGQLVPLFQSLLGIFIGYAYKRTRFVHGFGDCHATTEN